MIYLFTVFGCSEKDPADEGKMERIHEAVNNSTNGISIHPLSLQELNKSFDATSKRRVKATPLFPYPLETSQELQND